MKVLILNPILFTADNNVIPQAEIHKRHDDLQHVSKDSNDWDTM